MLKEVALKTTELPQALMHKLVYKALLSRKVEEKLLEVYAQGDLHGTVHTCIGQEFCGAVISEFINEGDAVFSNHRCHGHYLSITDDIEGLIAEIYGKETGVCGGRGGSQHLYRNGFYSNGIQGGIVPVAAGLAWAKKLKSNQNIAVVFVGDGTLGEGVLYETLNIISKWQLPLVLILENNKYSQSTSQAEVLAGDICGRAEAFAISSAETNTWNLEDLYWTVDEMVNYTRTMSKPSFIKIDTYRLSPHSKGDDSREASEIARYRSIDTLNQLLQTAEYTHLQAQIEKKIDDAIAKIKEIPNPIATSFELTPLNWQLPPQNPALCNEQMGKILHQTFKKLMQEHEKIYFIGEDVCAPYGGAFKISRDLSTTFPDRVTNTPISEAAIVGLANGLAIEGYKPIVEIMFGDFITLAMDQIINHAAKFRYMYNDQVNVPIIIRTPMGAGRGYGPTHSQTLDRHLLGIPGTRVMALNNLIHPAFIYETVINSAADPTIVIENKVLYTKRLRDIAPSGFTKKIIMNQCPAIIIKPETQHIDLTLLAYGGLSDVVLDCMTELFLEHDLIAQFICPIQLYPFDISDYMEIIQQGKTVALIEEGQDFASFSAEFIAQYSHKAHDNEMNFCRIASKPTAIPSSKALEDITIVNKKLIMESILAFIKNKQKDML